jgi:hypothetical protein
MPDTSSDQYVSKVGSMFVVTVVYDRDLDAVRTSSFGMTAMDAEITWNLISPGPGAPATLGDPPIRSVSPNDLVELFDLKRVSDTQATATLHIKGVGVVQAIYEVMVVSPAGRQLKHDPSIIVSHDPVEIP